MHVFTCYIVHGLYVYAYKHASACMCKYHNNNNILLHYVVGKHQSPVSTNKRTISFVSDTTTTTTAATTTSITTATTTTTTTNSLSKPSNAIGGKNSAGGVGKLLMHTYIHVNCV